MLKALGKNGKIITYNDEWFLASDSTNEKEPVLNGVNFIDYDGTLVDCWTRVEALAATALPNNPSHEGLVSNGWNWTLAEIQDYLTKYPHTCPTVGQLYNTPDGSTRVIIYVPSTTDVYLRIGLNGTAVINWGDGSSAETISGTSVNSISSANHEYAHGFYALSFKVTGSSVIKAFANNTGGTLIASETNYTSTGDRVKRYVEEVNIGDNVTVGDQAFSFFERLLRVSIPRVSNIGVGLRVYCNNNISAIIVPPNNEIPEDNNGCGARWVSTPYQTYSQRRGALSIGQRLRTITFPRVATTMNLNQFNGDSFLNQISIPETVTTFVTRSMQGLERLSDLYFYRTTPATAQASDVFSGLSTSCVIHVPKGSLEAYTTATNYPDPTVYTYVEDD